jgi:beta-galactosidase
MIFSWKMRILALPHAATGIFLAALSLAGSPAGAQTRETFRPDRMDTVLYGVAYYPEYMPYDRLDQDVELMQKAGISVVRIGESSWGLWEPQDGKF